MRIAFLGKDGGVSRTQQAPPQPAPAAPAATRTAPPGWRDPRLWVGVLIVALSVVAGARIIGAVDDSVTVWSAASDLAPGQSLSADDLVATRVRFTAEEDLDRYLTTGATLPADAVVVAGVRSGELVPRSALGGADGADTIDVSLSIPGEQLPTTIDTGSVVDVFLLAEPGTRARAEKVLDDVVVIDAPAPSEQLGSAGVGRQLVLAVPTDQEGRVGAVLTAVRDDRIRVTRQSAAPSAAPSAEPSGDR